MDLEVQELSKQGIVILYSGKAGSGKNTFADFVTGEIPICYNIRHYAFADDVKTIATLTGWDGNKDDYGRYVLQTIGTIGRHYSKDFWAKKLIRKIISNIETKKYDKNEYVINITDLRFDNEYECIKKFLSERFNIIHVSIENPNSYDLGDNSEHESENSLTIKPDIVIKNIGDIHELKRKAKNFVNQELSKYLKDY